MRELGRHYSFVASADTYAALPSVGSGANVLK
jgi:hypothetical protein